VPAPTAQARSYTVATAANILERGPGAVEDHSLGARSTPDNPTAHETREIAAHIVARQHTRVERVMELADRRALLEEVDEDD